MVNQWCEHSQEFEMLVENLYFLISKGEQSARFHMKHPFSGVMTEFVEVAPFEQRLASLRLAAYELSQWWDD